MVSGRRARSESRPPLAPITGDGLATAGFGTGLVGTIISGGSLLLVVLVFVFGGVVQSVFQQTCESVTARHSRPC